MRSQDQFQYFEGAGFVIPFQKLVVIVFTPKAMALTSVHLGMSHDSIYILNGIFQLSQDKSKS